MRATGAMPTATTARSPKRPKGNDWNRGSTLPCLLSRAHARSGGRRGCAGPERVPAGHAGVFRGRALLRGAGDGKRVGEDSGRHGDGDSVPVLFRSLRFSPRVGARGGVLPSVRGAGNAFAVAGGVQLSVSRFHARPAGVSGGSGDSDALSDELAGAVRLADRQAVSERASLHSGRWGEGAASGRDAAEPGRTGDGGGGLGGGVGERAADAGGAGGEPGAGESGGAGGPDRGGALRPAESAAGAGTAGAAAEGSPGGRRGRIARGTQREDRGRGSGSELADLFRRFPVEARSADDRASSVGGGGVRRVGGDAAAASVDRTGGQAVVARAGAVPAEAGGAQRNRFQLLQVSHDAGRRGGGHGPHLGRGR